MTFPVFLFFLHFLSHGADMAALVQPNTKCWHAERRSPKREPIHAFLFGLRSTFVATATTNYSFGVI
jgi:hypothetical protein